MGHSNLFSSARQATGGDAHSPSLLVSCLSIERHKLKDNYSKGGALLPELNILFQCPCSQDHHVFEYVEYINPRIRAFSSGVYQGYPYFSKSATGFCTMD